MRAAFLAICLGVRGAGGRTRGRRSTGRLIGMPSKVTKATREAKATVIRYPLRPGAKAPDIWDALGDLEMYQMGAPFCHRCRRE